MVFMGRWYKPTSCEQNILASFSEVPWMLGRPMLVLARSTKACESSKTYSERYRTFPIRTMTESGINIHAAN